MLKWWIILKFVYYIGKVMNNFLIKKVLKVKINDFKGFILLLIKVGVFDNRDVFFLKFDIEFDFKKYF